MTGHQEIKNHENHEQNTVTVPNFDVGSSVNFSRVSFQALQIASEQNNNDVSASNVPNHSSIEEAFEVRQPSSCSAAYTASEIAVQSEVKNERAEELSSDVLDKDSFLENEHDDCVIEESPEDNHNMSEQNLKDEDKNIWSRDTSAIEENDPKDNHNTSEHNLKEGNESVVSHDTSAVEENDPKDNHTTSEQNLNAGNKSFLSHDTSVIEENDPKDNHITSQQNLKERNTSVVSHDTSAVEENDPKDNHTTSEENLKEGNKSVVSHHTSAVEKDDQEAAVFSTTKLREEDRGSADGQEEDLEALVKLTTIHATALVHIGIIQVDAIESASIKIG